MEKRQSYAVTLNWTAIEPSSPLLPRPSSFMASYYDSNAKIIHLLGGLQYPQQWIQYDISSNTFTDNGNQSLEQGTPIYHLYNSQYYTQMRGYIYWMDEHELYRTDASRFGRKNSAIQMDPNWDGYHSCLTHSDSYLFVISRNRSHIFDVNRNSWETGPMLNDYDRSSHGCTYNHIMEEIYVIGGRKSTSYEQILSNERIVFMDSVGNSSEEWEYVDDLIFGVVEFHAFYNELNDSVVVIGGDWTRNYDTVNRKELQVIDCETGTVSIAAYLSYGVRQYTSIWADNVLYVFGGQTDGEVTDKWQIMEARPEITEDPTPGPTSAPSQPSIAPTKRPTFAPTDNPTKRPTIIANPPTKYGEGEAADVTPSGGLAGNSNGNTIYVHNSDLSVLVAVIIGLLLICAVVLCAVYMIWKRMDKMENVMTMQSSMLSQNLEIVRKKYSMDVVYEMDGRKDSGPGYTNDNDTDGEDREKVEDEEKMEEIKVEQPTNIMEQASVADSMYVEVEEESLNGVTTKGIPGVDDTQFH